MATRSTRPPDIRRLDVLAVAEGGELLQGEWTLGELSRLHASQIEGTDNAGEAVRWQIEGGAGEIEGRLPMPALHVSAQASVVLQCQRCLQPLPLLLDAERTLLFVEGEDAAAALDEQTDDDVLALLPAIDGRALIEDELLLAMPLVPRHEVCPEPLKVPDDVAEAEPPEGAEEKPNPFAKLAALKKS